MNISWCGASGSIPNFLGSFSALSKLTLESNNFTGNYFWWNRGIHMKMCIGTVTGSLCEVSTLVTLSFTANPLSCYATCLLMIFPALASSGYSRCKSGADHTLCGLIAATDISTHFVDWACITTGYVASHPCNWAGVNCTNNIPDVIDLRSQALRGTLPDSIGYLTSLTKLSFGAGYLNGRITYFPNCCLIVVNRNDSQQHFKIGAAS